MTERPFGPTLAMVGMIVFIDSAGIGLVVPVMPSLIMGVAHVTIDRAAEIGGWLLFAYAFTQFLFAPVIGGLSDRFGRRPVLLFTLAALGIDYVVMAVAPTLAWLFVGRIISGAMGATWTAANSCVADRVPPADRGRTFGILGGVGAAGLVAGPAIGGFAGQFGDRVPFVIAAGLALSGAVLAYFRLEETLAPEKRRRFSALRTNPLGGLRHVARSPLIRGCLVTIFLMQLAVQAQLSIWSFYGALKFDWAPLEIGLTVTLFGVLLVVSQGLLVGRAIARFGTMRTARVSLLFGVPSYAVLAFAATTPVMILGIVLGAIAGMTLPAMQSLMTLRTDERSQGELQGAIASVIGLTAIVGPPLMTGVFGAFSDRQGLYFPGAPFLLAGGCVLTGAAWLWLTLARHGGNDLAAI